ncbi:MAG: DNA/RNA non-specific endonuclease [Bacteroides sp.]|nr:DNA/RNA non-specific endonuclease [Bacteroides sp.]
MQIKKCNLFFLITFLLCSCHQQDIDTAPEPSQRPVQFQSTISGQGYQTRASGTTWGDDSIGVYMIKAGEPWNDATVLADNRIYETHSNGTFTPSNIDQMIFLPEDGSAVNFITYYPYQASLQGYIFPVDISDQSSQENIDLLYAAPAAEYTREELNVPFSFSHQLVKLVLNLSPSAEEETLEGIIVQIQGMKTKATFDLATGNLTTDESSGPEITLKTTSYTTGKAQAEAILLPTAQIAGVQIIFTLPSGESTTWDLTDEPPFQAGNRYAYDVILKGDQASVQPNYGWFETPLITSAEHTIYVTHFLPEAEKSHIRNYSLLYDTRERLAYWVAYPMHNIYVGNAERTNAWQYDPLVPQEYQPYLLNSYPDGNLDRGHQLASADRNYSQAGNRTTFYFSNMTPQNATLNQGIWANLEAKIRNTWMPACDTLYVVTGAMVTTTTDKEVVYTLDRANNECALPKYYFKALAQKRGETYYTIAFRMNNEAIPRNNDLTQYQLSVSELEEDTGFTFFPALSKEIKDQIHASIW